MHLLVSPTGLLRVYSQECTEQLNNPLAHLANSIQHASTNQDALSTPHALLRPPPLRVSRVSVQSRTVQSL